MDVYMPWKWKQNCVEPMGLLGKGRGLWKAGVGLLKNTCPYLTHHEAQWTYTNKDNRSTLYADTVLGSKPLFLNSIWSRPYPMMSWGWHKTSHQALQCLLYTAHFFYDYNNSIKLLWRRLCLLLNFYLVSTLVLALECYLTELVGMSAIWGTFTGLAHLVGFT